MQRLVEPTQAAVGGLFNTLAAVLYPQGYSAYMQSMRILLAGEHGSGRCCL